MTQRTEELTPAAVRRLTGSTASILPDVSELSRRRFIQGAAVGAGGLALTPWLDVLQAHAAPALRANDGIVVLVELDGGNDGLNTLIPYGAGRYRDLRPTLGISSNRVLKINSTYGLHPRLVDLKRRYDNGKVAFIRGVGYNPPDFSHFTSMALVQQGWGGTGVGPASGWVGRYADGLRGSSTETMYAVSLGWDTPLSLVGRRFRPAGLPLWINGAFGIDAESSSDRRLNSYVAQYADAATGQGRWGDKIARTQADVLSLARRIEPMYNENGLPDDNFRRQMTLAARLINLNLGARVIHVELGGFDNHANQAGDHANLLGALDTGIRAFYETMASKWRRQCLMVVFSEFGRRPEENGDAGTDHGTSAPWIVIGDAVKGGLHGAQPSMRASDFEHWGNFESTVDYRQVYATLLRRWLRADPSQVLGRRYENLDILRYTL